MISNLINSTIYRLYLSYCAKKKWIGQKKLITDYYCRTALCCPHRILSHWQLVFWCRYPGAWNAFYVRWYSKEYEMASGSWIPYCYSDDSGFLHCSQFALPNFWLSPCSYRNNLPRKRSRYAASQIHRPTHRSTSSSLSKYQNPDILAWDRKYRCHER